MRPDFFRAKYLTFPIFTNFHPRSLKAYEREIAAARVELAELRTKIAERALALVGAPSVLYSRPDLGMCPRTGFDCSGFVSHILDFVGVPRGTLRHANEYLDDFGIGVGFPVPGDLVVFTRDGTRPTHMGVVVAPGRFVHAPGTRKRGSDAPPELVREDAISPRNILQENPEIIYPSDPCGYRRAVRVFGTWKVW